MPKTSGWNTLTNAHLRTVQEHFGETVWYKPLAHPGFSLEAHFDEAYQSVDVQGEVEVVSTSPVLDVMLEDLPVPPAQGDRVTVGTGRTAKQFEVTKQEIDGMGGALLMLYRI